MAVEMNWVAGVEKAFRAESAIDAGDLEMARTLYAEAADLQERASEAPHLGPITRAVFARSAVACLYKAGQYERTLRKALCLLKDPEIEGHEGEKLREIGRACRAEILARSDSPGAAHENVTARVTVDLIGGGGDVKRSHTVTIAMKVPPLEVADAARAAGGDAQRMRRGARRAGQGDGRGVGEPGMSAPVALVPATGEPLLTAVERHNRLEARRGRHPDARGAGARARRGRGANEYQKHGGITMISKGIYTSGDNDGMHYIMIDARPEPAEGGAAQTREFIVKNVVGALDIALTERPTSLRIVIQALNSPHPSTVRELRVTGQALIDACQALKSVP